MNKQQQKLYQLLVEIDNICKTNDITYYLAAGCALGAIRQGRFLPWDDDVDIFITRDNWEKFKTVLEENCPNNRKLIHNDNTPYYRNTVARYVDLTTIYLNKLMMTCPEVCSIAVEFFILDPFPKKEEEQENHIRSLKTYAELLYVPSVLNKERSKLRDDFDLQYYKQFDEQMGTAEEKSIMAMLKSEFTKTSDEECDCYCMRWGRIARLFPKEMIKGYRTITFEGREFPVMCHSERSFREGYGDDWMYLPDVPEQRSHKSSLYVGDKDEFARFSMNDEEKKALFEAFKKRKQLNIEKYLIEEKRDYEFAKVRAQIAGDRLIRKCASLDLQKMLDERDFDALNDLFSQYYELLNNPYFNVYDVSLGLAENILYVAAENLILQGLYYKADGISESKEIQQQIEFCRALSVAIYDERDFDLAERILVTNPQYKNLIDYARGHLCTISKNAEITGEYDEIIAFADKAIEKFGRDGELLCYKANAVYKLGDKKIAKALFAEGVSKTRNGFLLRMAEELCGVTKPEDDYATRSYYIDGMVRLLKGFDEYCKTCSAEYQITGIGDSSEADAVLALIESEQVEIAMYGEDLNRLEKTVNTGDTGFYVERIENNPYADGFAIRFYDLQSCLIDLRDYNIHANHGLFLVINEIERQGTKAERATLNMMTDVWLKGNIEKYIKRRKKVRLKAKVIYRFGLMISEKSKQRRLREYKRKHFCVTKQEAARSDIHLKIGENIVTSEHINDTFNCYIKQCGMEVQISSSCDKGPVGAYMRQKYARRFRFIDENDSFDQIIDKEIEEMINKCLEYQKQFLKISRQITPYARIIDDKWHMIKSIYDV